MSNSVWIDLPAPSAGRFHIPERFFEEVKVNLRMQGRKLIFGKISPEAFKSWGLCQNIAFDESFRFPGPNRKKSVGCRAVVVLLMLRGLDCGEAVP